MTFLQPWLLLALPLALTPIIVHLMNLRRHRKVEWGAMQFLLQATRQRRGHTRLRHLLILLLRVLAVVALVFVISRPMTGRWFHWFAARPETVIVVLDRSPSMAQQDVQTGVSKRSRALSQLTDAIRQVGGPRNLVLIENSGRPPQLLASVDELTKAASTVAVDAAADIPAMLQQALEYLVANQSGRTDVWVCSDLQHSDWRPASPMWNMLRSEFASQSRAVRFHLLTYASPAPQNLSVRVANLRRERAAGQADQLRMDIQLRRDASAAEPRSDRSVRVAVIVDGARSVVEIPLAADSGELLNHSVPLDRQRTSGWGRIELDADANPRDNAFFFVYGDYLTPRTVVVSDEPTAAWPLKLAAAPERAMRQQRTARVLAPDEVDSIDWRDFSLCLWQSALPVGESEGRLEEFVDDGGQVIFFPPTPATFATAPDRVVFQHRWAGWSELSSKPTSPAQSVDQWRDDSGLWAHSDAGEPLPVTRLSVSRYCQLVGPGQVQARLNSGDPLLVSVPKQRGGVHFITTLPQEAYSNLAREGVVLLVAIQRALAAGAERVLAAQVGEIHPVGARAAVASQVGRWQQRTGWPEGKLSTEKSLVAGVYQDGERFFARNRPPSEDIRRVLEPAQLDDMFAGVNYRTVEDSLESGRSLVSEIWRVFGALMLLALIAEAVLCLPDVRSKLWVPA